MDTRAAYSSQMVTVFGGSGFLGRHVVRALARRGWRVRVAVRRPDLAGFLQPLGGVGQVHAVQANLRYPESVEHAVAGAAAVVNLVGILVESGRQGFEAVQAEGAGLVAEAAKAAGAQRLVQVSALGADPDSDSDYARSKARGEALVGERFPGAVVLRPSVVFGPEDKFFNQFANLARYLPVLPLFGGGTTAFQPVFVGDVAEAVALALDGKAGADGPYELGGPQVMTFREVLEFVLETTGRKRALVPIPWPIARLQAAVLEWVPGQPLTRDQIKLLQRDNVVSQAAILEGRTLEGLGIAPVSVAAEAPSYLYRFRARGQFADGGRRGA